MGLQQKKLAIKSNMPAIYRDGENPFLTSKNKGRRASYATLSNILKEITALLNEHKVVVDISFEMLSDTIVRAHLYAHDVDSGEAEQRTYDFLIDDAQGNAVQRSGSTMTYAQRYVYAAYFGIAFDDEDPDARDNPKVHPQHKSQQTVVPPTTPSSETYANEKIYTELFELCKLKGITVKEKQIEFLSRFGISSFKTIPIDKVESIRETLAGM